jgi:hypothetical protein
MHALNFCKISLKTVWLNKYNANSVEVLSICILKTHNAVIAVYQFTWLHRKYSLNNLLMFWMSECVEMLRNSGRYASWQVMIKIQWWIWGDNIEMELWETPELLRERPRRYGESCRSYNSDHT